MFDLKKFLKPKEIQNNNQRKIDLSIEKTANTLSSKFSLMSKQNIAAWKAYLIIFFVGGFFAAVILGSYNRWYVSSKANNPTVVMSAVTDVANRHAGDQYTDHVRIDTGGTNIVAVQAIASYDPAKVQIVSIDDSLSDFPNVVLNNNDTIKHRIFVALARPTPGMSSAQGKIVDVTIKALADFNGSALTLKFDTPNAVDDSAAILDDGNGTNSLTSVTTTIVNNPPADTTPSILSGGSPTGTLSVGTTSATLRVLTNEAATCKYGTAANTSYGSIANTFTTTGANNHTSTLNGLTNGTSYNYFIRCKDSAGNPNQSDYKVNFSIASASGDSTAPTVSGGSPTGTLKAGTTSVTLKVRTNEKAICKYATTAGVDFDSMTNTLTGVSATSYASKMRGLGKGSTYNIYVRCKDVAGNKDTSDYSFSFSIGPPTMSSSSPSGMLSAGTTSTTISMKTNQAATCKYGTSSRDYGRLSNTFSSTGGTDHSSTVSVSSGQTYRYYVRCKDAAGNTTKSSLLIMFSVP